MATDDRVAAWLADIGSILEGSLFVASHKDFVGKHCDAFFEDEENRLEYTAIFEEYVEFVEKHIDTGMKDKSVDFSMEQLMEALPDYTKRAPPANNSMSEGMAASAKAVDLLLGLADFENFKATMLLAKRDKGEKKGNEILSTVTASDAAVGTDLEGLVMNSGAAFASEEGWARLCDRAWLIVEKKDTEIEGKKSSLVKTTITIDLPLMDARTLFTEFTPRRKGWDDRFAGAVVHKTFPGRGINQIVTVKNEMPYIMKLMGVPEEFTVRLIEKVDFPHKGDYYHMVAAWDLKNDCVDKNNKFLDAKAGVVRAHPTEPNKTLMIGTSTNKMNWIPDWVTSTLLATFMPKMVLSMVDKFKKYKKDHQPWENFPIDFA